MLRVTGQDIAWRQRASKLPAGVGAATAEAGLGVETAFNGKISPQTGAIVRKAEDIAFAQMDGAPAAYVAATIRAGRRNPDIFERRQDSTLD